MHSVPITIPGAPHNFTLTYIHSQLSSFATLYELNFVFDDDNVFLPNASCGAELIYDNWSICIILVQYCIATTRLQYGTLITGIHGFNITFPYAAEIFTFV